MGLTSKKQQCTTNLSSAPIMPVRPYAHAKALDYVIEKNCKQLKEPKPVLLEFYGFIFRFNP